MLETYSQLEKSLGILYYSTIEKGIGGRIRVTPEEFLVEEITPEGIIVNENLKKLNRGKGNYTLAVLKKISKPLLPIISMIERKINAKISFAGIKDRRALTYQLISINKTFRGEIKLKGIEIWSIGSSKWKIYPGELKGNRFTIVIREPKEIPEYLNINWIPGYFGHQRFGITRPNTHKIGKLLVKGDFDKAIKEFIAKPYEYEPSYIYEVRKKIEETWNLKSIINTIPNELIYEKIVINSLIHDMNAKEAFCRLPKRLLRLFIEAYQSYLFNLILSKRWKEYGLFDVYYGDVISPLDNYFNPSIKIEVKKENYEKLRKLVLKGKAVIMLPLPGSNVKGINEEIYHEIFDLEGIKREDIILAFSNLLGMNFKDVYRPVVFYIKNFEILEKSENRIKLRFSLPRGCYATILLREIIKPSDPKSVGF
ncbi:MAG: tRNA pseudouridine(13) synthase TruD [Candidatus Verstraetearchaeota archaeon]|nr:tRNA pseudouridine(13) synthase TruD [Candidatus Verstraetearchaeota archaeon]